MVHLLNNFLNRVNGFRETNPQEGFWTECPPEPYKMVLQSADLKKAIKSAMVVQPTTLLFGDGKILAWSQQVVAEVLHPALTGFPEIQVDAKVASSSVHHLSGNLEVGLQNGALNIRSSRITNTLGAVQGGSPKLPQVPTNSTPLPMKVVGPVLSLLSQTTDEKNSFDYEGVIQIEFGGSTVTAVATDGKRILVSKSECQGAGSVLVSAKIARCLGEFGDETITLHQTEGAAIYQGSKLRLFTRKPTAKFPDWKKVVPSPSTSEREVRISREALLETLHCLTPVIMQDSDPRVVLCFDCDLEGKEELMLRSSDSKQLGTNRASGTCPVVTVRPDPVFDTATPCTVTMNHKHLMAFLDSAKSDITMHIWNDKKSPVYIRSRDDQFTGVFARFY